ncbi:MAG: hypothetical protein ACYTFW_21185, partial [Planctomycetota bacterium]
IESVAYDRPIQQIQRVFTDAVDVPGISWNLAELVGQTTQAQPEVIFTEGMTEITAQQMAERALVETYVFGRTPDWIAEQTFIEALDEASPLRRMFVVLCRATDGRHIALTQGSTLGQYLEAALGMIKKAGFQWTPRVFAGNRFKLHVLPDFRYLESLPVIDLSCMFCLTFVTSLTSDTKACVNGPQVTYLRKWVLSRQKLAEPT